MRKIVLIILIICCSSIVIAQDIHFSQSFLSPLTLNPACTGNNGDYRFVGNYKDQWRSVSNTYKTVFASADIVPVRKKDGFIGIGLSFYNDKAGKSDLGTTQINIPVSYTARINRVHFLTGAVQAGYTQKSINTNNLKWDNQYDGSSYDPNLPTGEGSFTEKKSFMDLTAGLLWSYIPDKENKISLGTSVLHINNPNQSYTGNPDALKAKIVVHGSGEIKLNKRNGYIVPILLYTNQGKLNEVNAGGMIKYGLGLDSKYTGVNKSSSISFGALYRVKDAIIILVNMEYKRAFTFGFSYDINVSRLTAASKGRGGMELCIAYSGFFNKEK